MSQPSGSVSPTGSPFAVAVMFFGYGFVMASSYSRGARAIAVVATIGYGGFLLGAPLIGLLAHTMPLDRALLAVVVLVLLIAVLAPVARERGAQASKSKG